MAAAHHTLKSVFPHVQVFITSKDEFTDFLLLASREPVDLNHASEGRRIRCLLDHKCSIADRDGVTITDDYNPMEHPQVRKSETYRKLSRYRIAFELLLR